VRFVLQRKKTILTDFNVGLAKFWNLPGIAFNCATIIWIDLALDRFDFNQFTKLWTHNFHNVFAQRIYMIWFFVPGEIFLVQFPQPGRLQVSTLTVSPPPKPELFVVGMHFSSRLAPVSGTKLPGLVSRYTRICTCPAVTAAGRRLPAWEKSTFGPLKCCKDLRGGSKTVCEIIIFFAPYKTSIGLL